MKESIYVKSKTVTRKSYFQMLKIHAYHAIVPMIAICRAISQGQSKVENKGS